MEEQGLPEGLTFVEVINNNNNPNQLDVSIIPTPTDAQCNCSRETTMLENDAEIKDNTISSEVIPIDLLRAKLSFFGAFHFDPRSDRWVRINMFKGAPLPQTLNEENCDNWTYPKQKPN